MNVTEFIKANIDLTTKYHQNTVEENDTLIALPYPFTTPCAAGHFQEMYYWDTYFTNKGLYLLGKGEQAVNNIKNMAWILEKYGKIPNGNRTWYLNHSQPPFFGCMLEDALTAAPDLISVKEAFQWLQKEYLFWQTNRMTESGLNGYSCDFTDEECMESGAVHMYLDRTGIQLEYTPKNNRSVEAECESGWDFSPRFESTCIDFNPVDLNCLLYKDEVLLAKWASQLEMHEMSVYYARIAQDRKDKIVRLMKKGGIYYDYNYVNETLSPVVSCASFFPYWVGIDNNVDDFATTLKHLEVQHGVIPCDWDKGNYQWTSPNCWAPLTCIAVSAAMNINLVEDAKRLAMKYIESTDDLFKETQNLWEKYNAKTGKLDVVTEYGTPPMLGWSAGVYVYLQALMEKETV